MMSGSRARNSSGGAAAAAAPRKMVLKPFKRAPLPPKNFEDESWKELKQAIVAVQKRERIAAPQEKLYGLVQDLCNLKKSEMMYEGIKTLVEEHLEHCLRTCYESSIDVGSFLEQLESAWKDHGQTMHTIRNIFIKLDRSYAMSTVNVKSIWDVGLALYRNILLGQANSMMLTKCIDGLLHLIEKERNGESVNRSLIYNLIKMLTALDLYESKFESEFISRTREFYKAEGLHLMESTDIPQFLLHTENRFREENERLGQYLEPSTRKELLVALESQLLEPHVDGILEKGFALLMDSNRVDELTRMYILFNRLRPAVAVNKLKVALSTYVKSTGCKIVGDIEQEKKMVVNLLALKSRLDNIIATSFQSYSPFLNTVKDAMEHAVNSKPNRPAELVAKFVDSKLRAGSKGGSDIEIESLLDDAMVIFRYIEGKDTFEAFYKKALAKRLLLGKSASLDLEKAFISKLKSECGNAFTSKLEGMFKDVDLSKDVMNEFKENIASRQELGALQMSYGVDLVVQVLTTGFWPPYTRMTLDLPAELSEYEAVFNKFYKAKYQGRKLEWQHSLGQCLVRSNFPKGKKDLAVSLFQTLVLLRFNYHSRIGFRQLKESTGIEDGELRRTLQSLACGPVKVLQKEPRGREVGDDDEFVFNEGFTNERMRIKINSIQMKETPQESTKTHEKVFKDRQYQVDAAIVRIMKSRKKLGHQLLMSELYSQLKFPAQPSDIKKRIESLIDREYLARDEGNPQEKKGL